eukprot:3702226-Pyramimonas_sp.AAC.1
MVLWLVHPPSPFPRGMLAPFFSITLLRPVPSLPTSSVWTSLEASSPSRKCARTRSSQRTFLPKCLRGL